MAQSYIYIFGIYLNIDRVAFTIPGINWSIYWYGIILTAGFVLAIIYGMKRAKSFGINNDKLLDAIIVTSPCSIICARLYYIIFDPDVTMAQFFNIHDGGIAIYGSVIGAAVVGALMCKIKKINIPAALDLTALGFLIGQGIGRWGNFVNQEAYGVATGSSWFGMTGDVIAAQNGSTQLVHPCFLYESLWCLLGFVILHILSKRRIFSGQIAAGFLIWNGFGRFFIEGLRTDSLYLGAIRVSQLLAALMVVAGIIIIIFGCKKAKDAAKSDSYKPVFELNELEREYSAEDDENGESENSNETDFSVDESTERVVDENVESPIDDKDKE